MSSQDNAGWTRWNSLWIPGNPRKLIPRNSRINSFNLYWVKSGSWLPGVINHSAAALQGILSVTVRAQLNLTWPWLDTMSQWRWFQMSDSDLDTQSRLQLDSEFRVSLSRPGGLGQTLACQLYWLATAAVATVTLLMSELELEDVANNIRAARSETWLGI